MADFSASPALLARDGGWLVWLIMAGVGTVAGLILCGVYWLNQRAIRDELLPRRQELHGLIASLNDTNQAE